MTKYLILLMLLAGSIMGRNYDDHYWEFLCKGHIFSHPPGIPASCYERIPDRWTFEVGPCDPTVDTTCGVGPMTIANRVWDDLERPAVDSQIVITKYFPPCHDTTWTKKVPIFLSPDQVKWFEDWLKNKMNPQAWGAPALLITNPVWDTLLDGKTDTIGLWEILDSPAFNGGMDSTINDD